MVAPMTTLTRPRVSGLDSSTCSRTPIPIEAATAIGMDDIRAITAPASPLSSRSGPRVSMDCPAVVGVTRIAENAAMAPAIAQASVVIRLAGMPSSSAVSVSSEAARIAMPTRWLLRNRDSPTSRIGAKISIAM